MKTAVIYKSKYGSAKQYAYWIAESVNADIFEEGDINNIDFSIYDNIVYGGGLYAGGINGINSIVKIYDKIKEKKLIIFTVGLSDTNNEENIKNIKLTMHKTLPIEILDNADVFHLRGAMDYKKLGPIHKTMMAMLRKSVSKKAKDKLTEEDNEMLNTYGKKVDFIKLENIENIVKTIKGEK